MSDQHQKCSEIVRLLFHALHLSTDVVIKSLLFTKMAKSGHERLE